MKLQLLVMLMDFAVSHSPFPGWVVGFGNDPSERRYGLRWKAEDVCGEPYIDGGGKFGTEIENT